MAEHATGTGHGAEVTMTPSQAGDEGALARLWCITFAEEYRHIFGNGAEAFVETWLSRDPRVHQGSVLARVNGDPAGLIQLGLPKASLVKDTLALWSALQRHFGPFGAISRLLRIRIMERNDGAALNDLQVRMMAVDPHYRGKGLATTLLHYAEAAGMREQKDRLVLEVSSAYQDAIRVYERHGFRRESVRKSLVRRWAVGQPEYYRMTKRLK